MNRKNFLQTSLASAFAMYGFNSFSFSFNRSYNNKLPKMTLEQTVLENAPFSLPALPYAPESLEPSIDKMTMEIHHGRHHKAYIDNMIIVKPNLLEIMRMPVVRPDESKHHTMRIINSDTNNVQLIK